MFLTTNLSADATMSSTVGPPLNTRPEVCESRQVHTLLSHTGRCRPARDVANLALDAVIVDLVARSQSVGVICEWSILDTAFLSSAVSAEAYDGV